MTEPGELAHRDERQRLVGRLEDLSAFVEHVAPGGLVVGDTRVQHEVVVAARDRDRIELDRPELSEDLEHAVEASRERPRGREEVPRNEKAARLLSTDLHTQDTSRVRVDRARVSLHTWTCCAPVSGTGNRRIQTGTTRSGGPSSSRRTRSSSATSSFCSTRSPFPTSCATAPRPWS